MRKILKVERGFTFFEVITVILILGIIGAIAIVKMSSPATYGVIGELDKVKSHLRYAQGRAIRTNSSWGVNFNSASVYWLFQNAVATKINFFGENPNQVNLSNLSITSAPLTITFDRFGSPGTADITVATSGGNITVTANTGFIP